MFQHGETDIENVWKLSLVMSAGDKETLRYLQYHKKEAA